MFLSKLGDEETVHNRQLAKQLVEAWVGPTVQYSTVKQQYSTEQYSSVEFHACPA